MTKAKKETVSFSKFFPSSASFVVVDGYAKGRDDFNISLKIGDGEDAISFWFNEYTGKDRLAALNSLKEAADKALAFYTKALSMPKSEDDLYEYLGLKNPASKFKKPAAKKTAAKK